MKNKLKAAVYWLRSLFGRGEGWKTASNASNPKDSGLGSAYAMTYLADAANTERFSLVKSGSDQYHVAESAADSDKIIGVCMDEPSAAEEPVQIAILGTGVIPMVAAGALAVDVYVCSNGDGRVKAAASAKYTVGKTLRSSAGAGDVILVATVMSPHVEA